MMKQPGPTTLRGNPDAARLMVVLSYAALIFNASTTFTSLLLIDRLGNLGFLRFKSKIQFDKPKEELQRMPGRNVLAIYGAGGKLWNILEVHCKSALWFVRCTCGLIQVSRLLYTASRRLLHLLPDSRIYLVERTCGDRRIRFNRHSLGCDTVFHSVLLVTRDAMPCYVRALRDPIRSRVETSNFDLATRGNQRFKKRASLQIYLASHNRGRGGTFGRRTEIGASSYRHKAREMIVWT